MLITCGLAGVKAGKNQHTDEKQLCGIRLILAVTIVSSKNFMLRPRLVFFLTSLTTEQLFASRTLLNQSINSPRPRLLQTKSATPPPNNSPLTTKTDVTAFLSSFSS